MERLSEFKPLSRVTLPDIGDLPCSGLTIVVGPNSSGKSQFLKDIYSRLGGEPRSTVVAKSVLISKPPNWNAFLDCLVREGHFEKYSDENNSNVEIRPRQTYSGSNQAAPNIALNQGEAFYNLFDGTDDKPRRKPIEFWNHFGKMLVTALFLENRLGVLNSIGLIDFARVPPQHNFHVLHRNDEAKAKLQREIYESFGRSVWTDITTGRVICLRVADGEQPSAEDRHSLVKMENFRTIESEGDGLKSYVTICIALLLARLPVCLIDEPEMCLHPPQAYNLGRFIGKHAASKESATFVPRLAVKFYAASCNQPKRSKSFV
jgi:hypothetical protein